MPDMVNHPSHYTAGGVECIEAIRAATGSQFTGYLWGNAMKYLWRFPAQGKRRTRPHEVQVVHRQADR